MSIWAEISNEYFNENEKCIYIDAWLTDNHNEEGKVIAKVYEDKVEYIDQKVITDDYAQEIINNAIEKLKSGN